MEKQNKALFGIIMILVISVFTMAIGFAVQTYTQSLEINGTATFKAAKWQIEYDENSYVETSGSVAATTHSLDTTTLVFDVTLENPGDFYEASATVLNKGTFDANLTSIVISNPLTTGQQKFASFKVYYDGTEYLVTTENLELPLVKETGSKDVKVRVEYNLPDVAEDLPEADLENVEFAVTLNYEQAE